MKKNVTIWISHCRNEFILGTGKKNSIEIHCILGQIKRGGWRDGNYRNYKSSRIQKHQKEWTGIATNRGLGARQALSGKKDVEKRHMEKSK